ncbi:glycoside hydrolase family 31 protein [uncultured Acetatifactor sp.]|jgi:alpha-D-xyloside xylohydrolase|uniref:glycoside hydrolase family 31 protein n=1 Tax=uncultured Acetatifactor sp. TaxID=1671927 RepID=UPI002603C6D1|nr:glycoside hydrolase family 31 protein [uncultured Acetatifactor sp.]
MLEFFEVREGSLIYRENGETLMVTPWGKDSLRVRSVFAGEVEEGSVALLEPEPAEADIVIGEWEASITNGNIKARLWVNGWGHALQIGFYNQRGELLLREISNGGALQKKARHFRPLPGGEYELKVSFEASPEEKIYGMGQYQQEVMNLKGCNLELAHRNSQASIPFCLSDKGYGFLWHNAAVGEVHFGTNTTEWLARSAMQMDYWITAGDTPAQIEEAYALATGKSPMMPEYGLGFWQCKLRYYNQEQVLRIAREYKERGITPDVLIIDYYHWPRCGDWRFDPEYFPDPEAMVKELREMGIETMVSVWPQVDVRSENFEEMKQKGLLLKSNMGVDVQMIFHGNNLFLDATNPRTRKYVWEKLKKNYADMGIRTFWLDEAEPEFGTYDFDLYTSSAGPMARTGNIYPREYARLVYEGQQEMGQRDVVNLIRCAWAGSQRYGALVWSGDIMSTYEDFRRQICAGLHMGICGIPWWTTDIGGFHGGNIEDSGFRELLVRWFQFGTFCPVMRLHGSRQPHQPIVNRAGEERECTGADNEIWSFGEEAYPILVKFIGIRERMRDYTREVMRQAHEKGSPVMRTLFYEFPEDKECWDITDAYLYGPDILVAPVCHEGAEGRRVYLPQGASWTHAGTGEVYEGGVWLDVEAPLETVPLFLRDGRQGYLVGML